MLPPTHMIAKISARPGRLASPVTFDGLAATLPRVYARIEYLPGSALRRELLHDFQLTAVRESSERPSSPRKVASMSRVESRQPAGSRTVSDSVRTSNPRLSRPSFMRLVQCRRRLVEEASGLTGRCAAMAPSLHVRRGAIRAPRSVAPDCAMPRANPARMTVSMPLPTKSTRLPFR